MRTAVGHPLHGGADREGAQVVVEENHEPHEPGREKRPLSAADQRSHLLAEGKRSAAAHQEGDERAEEPDHEGDPADGLVFHDREHRVGEGGKEAETAREHAADEGPSDEGFERPARHEREEKHRGRGDEADDAGVILQVLLDSGMGPSTQRRQSIGSNREWVNRPAFAFILSAVPLPRFGNTGDLPPGIHTATLDEVEVRFGGPPATRKRIAERLRRIHDLATGTGHLARFVIFGSFVTDEPEPNDLDIVMIMDDAFDAGTLTGETALLFEHPVAQPLFGASVFWVRRFAALGGEDAFVNHWQVKRDGSLRGIVEVFR